MGFNTACIDLVYNIYKPLKSYVKPSKSEGLKAFLSLSFPWVIFGNFGKKPFTEFLKAFPDLERD